MKAKKWIVLAAAMALLLCGCGEETTVNVQRADRLAIAGQAGERYAGIVVSENVVEITRDTTKTVEELYVEVGQEVSAGEKLFTYDSDQLELELEKTQLEVEKMNNEQTTYTEQLEKLEKQLARTYNESTKVRLTLEINTLKTTMMENEYKLKSSATEIAKLQEMLNNIDITSPVDGTVRKIEEQGENGTYITIQQSGAYRIQGMINEMSMGNGLMVGSRVKAFSRVNADTWMGTVTSIVTEEASQNNSNSWYSYGLVDTMTTASSYVFYVELDSVEGLLLGQHVYMEVFLEEPEMPGLWIPEGSITDLAMDEQTYEMTGMVWADNGQGRLEQRTVTLGMYDGMTGCYEILSGLAETDYVADPAAPGCAAGATVSRREPEDFSGAETQAAATEPPAQETEDPYGIMSPIATAPEGQIPERGTETAEGTEPAEATEAAEG